ncbi:MAG TPA: hypothetical protein VFB08_10305 [Burkholderiales bacterium]|nr:hypothetical protein [Burkholderiales bacterium]
MKRRTLALLSAATLSAGASAQTTFKCLDAGGHAVYVDRACATYGLREIRAVEDRLNVAPPAPGAALGAPAPASRKEGEPRSDSAPAPQPQPRADDPGEIRKRAIALCQQSRASDCESDEALKQWMALETPLTDEQRQAAIAARRFRELCVKTQYTAPQCDTLQLCDQTQFTAAGCSQLLRN